ncbi:hypothetical protein BRETT_001192 [Brettanomyces bruxellensis]|uniref:PCI domain-containing protein n=1 Tax=Dekkera bruxellensis TaxID=5007 RepID=A0A871RCG3_DEKBR|nr:uncharacterized protein BRETT_001192 [Brettanomyces bruxellensis]QOU21468.1 hypothetical protein BRETT_001192 [Brettanomyces bruxellensis]
MKPYTLDLFLNDVKNAGTPTDLSSLLDVNPITAKHLPSLQQSLQSYDDDQLESIIENIHFYNNDWPAFETMIQKYLVYVKNIDPWSLLNSIDLMIGFYSSLSVALNNKQFHTILFKSTFDITNLIIPLTKFVDAKIMQIENRVNNYPRLSYLSTIMLKIVNNIRASPALDDLGSNERKDTISVLMSVCISLCNLYIFIDSPILCNNVFSNMNVLRLDKRLISRSQLINYRFVLGKFHLGQSNYFLAYKHFMWCFQNIHRDISVRSRIKILKYLIPCGLLVGKVADIQVLRDLVQSDKGGLQMIEIYSPLITCYKAGDIKGFSDALRRNRSYFIGLCLYVGFLQRVRILILRNLILKVYKITGRLNFEDVRSALNVSCDPVQQNASSGSLSFYTITDQINDSFVQNVLVALVDGNLIRAKLTASKNIILSRTNPFPDIYDIYKQKYAQPGKEDWLD